MAGIVARHLDDERLGELLGRLSTDGKAYVQAEIAYYKALAADRGGKAGVAAAYGAGAAVLALAGLIALLVGLILTLATRLGPGWATLIVVGVTFALAAVLGIMARNKARLITGPRP